MLMWTPGNQHWIRLVVVLSSGMCQRVGENGRRFSSRAMAWKALWMLGWMLVSWKPYFSFLFLYVKLIIELSGHPREPTYFVLVSV